ncbi:ShlB/FhaC/HecB family hemolysin secretion/activation protein [Candidatus Synechococcus calcipolaris G9]|uniref:ShlB/FhaC/HecB family hemolysin secretion/activation protein n=1 Tax=Candidatus Synechococcus calcipolaris G9 TaxID=1497997 RepID=A0ABT6F2M4_9SYNE|nr:ShlB/FhaC/HecB family hemolysin secretion/activation protein [Candidatus Synechococcus calcipolaris G9]
MPPPLRPDDEAPLAPPPPPPQPLEPTGITLNVNEIIVEGSTVFGPTEFDPIIAPLEGRAVDLEDLQQAADDITKLYLDNGYFSSRAELDTQQATDGTIVIQVFEGRLEDIEVEGNKGIVTSYITSRIRLGAGVPLNSDRLEDQLRLLRSDPLFENVSASLKPGANPEDSILVIRVIPANWFNASFGMDNNSPPAVAPERSTAFLAYRNLSGRGDTLYASYSLGNNLGTFNWGGSNTGEFGYSLPVNAMNGTLSLRTVIAGSKITQADVADFGIRSEASIYQIGFRQPVIRTFREELAFSAGFLAQNGQTFLFDNQPFPFGIGPNEDGYSASRVFEFAQDYTRRDDSGAWAFRSQFNFGVPIFGATQNPSPAPDGNFFSWVGNGQRVQQLWADNFMILRTDIQLSPNSLLPFHQFVIGGGLSVRGYPTNARSGDNGIRFSTEARFPVLRASNRRPIISINPLFDAGWVWNNSSNPNGVVPNNFLAGVGMGLLIQPVRNLDIKFEYAIPLLNLPDQAPSLQADGIYFSITMRP